MKPAKFDYVRADDVDEHLRRAGGIRRRRAHPRRWPIAVADAQHAPCPAQGFGRHFAIGAAEFFPHRECVTLHWRIRHAGDRSNGASNLADELPLVNQAFPHISHFQIRNRGTVCGSIAHADSSAELPLCLLALGGEIVLRSKRWIRDQFRRNDFFLGTLRTAREADELIEAVRLPLAKPNQHFAFDEFSMRHGDYAIVAVAAVADETDVTHRCRRCRRSACEPILARRFRQ